MWERKYKSLCSRECKIIYSSCKFVIPRKSTCAINKVTKGIKKDAGIYSIPCNSCNLYYIGESNCLQRRFQQHKSDLPNCNGNSALVKHRDNTGHAISVKNSSILCHVNNINQRKLIEFFLIKNFDDMNVYKASIAIAYWWFYFFNYA